MKGQKQLPQPITRTTVKILNQREARDAARRAELVVIDVRKIKGASDLGDYINQSLLKGLGPATLVVAGEYVKRNLAKCDALLAKPGLEPETEIKVIQSERQLIGQLIEIGNSMVLAAKNQPASLADVAQVNRSFGPRESVTPVQMTQVNIGINGQGAEISPKPINANVNGSNLQSRPDSRNSSGS